MVTKSIKGGELKRFSACWLLAVLAAAALLGDAAIAQPARPRGEAGPLDRMDHADRAAAETPAAEPAEATPPPNVAYEEDPVDEAKKRNLNNISQMLQAGKFASGQEAVFDDFYLGYYLARWTQAKNFVNLPTYRKELRNSHLAKKTASPEVHDHLNALVLSSMGKLMAGRYHPAVQVNAALMIGELNSVEQSGNEPATPLPAALDALLATVDNSNAPDALRAAAMVGIARHVAVGISDDEARRKLVAILLKVAGGDQASGAAAAGREWIIAQALENLSQLRSAGENNEIFRALVKAAADNKISFPTRTVAVESLGRLNYAAANGIRPVEVATVLGQFAMDACNDEMRLSERTGYPVSRRRTKQRLQAVLTALTGGPDANQKGIVSLAREPAEQSYVGELGKSIDAFISFVDDKKHESDSLEMPLDELRGKLEGWLKKKPA